MSLIIINVKMGFCLPNLIPLSHLSSISEVRAKLRQLKMLQVILIVPSKINVSISIIFFTARAKRTETNKEIGMCCHWL